MQQEDIHIDKMLSCVKNRAVRHDCVIHAMREKYNG